jgi:hypothetical protein
MKKVTTPILKASAKKVSITKQSAAKQNAKPSANSKPRKVQSQAELLPIVEWLAQAAERLTVATTGGAAARAHEATTRQNPALDTVL